MTRPTFLFLLKWSAKNLYSKISKQVLELIRGLLQALALLAIYPFVYRKFKSQEKATFLFIYPSKKALKINKQKSLISMFSEEELAIEVHYKKLSDIINHGYKPKLDWRSLLFPKQAWRANYFLSAYPNCKVIVVEKYDPFMNFFFTEYKQKQRLVQLAHSVITNDSPKFDLAICDDYITFGESSNEALRNSDKLVGKPNLITCGPYFLNSISKWQKAEAGDRLLLVACGPGFEKYTKIRQAYSQIDSWAKQLNISIDVKPHPLGHHFDTWSDTIEVLPASSKLNDIISRYRGAISIYSNAIVDLAATGIPTAVYSSPDIEDPWNAKDFLTTLCSSEDLNNFHQLAQSNSQQQSTQSSQYASYHWQEIDSPAKVTADAIKSLAN